MQTRFEKFVIYTAFGAVFPIFFFLAFWWISIGLVSEWLVPLCALFGLAAGLLADLVFFRKNFIAVFNIRAVWLTAIFVFYSVCTFGFFMGVPVFNLAPGILAGYYMGIRLRIQKADPNETKKQIRKTSLFASGILAFICAASAWLALKNPADTARNLEGMFGLDSGAVTIAVILGIILAGGAVLILAQYWLTKTIAVKTSAAVFK